MTSKLLGLTVTLFSIRCNIKLASLVLKTLIISANWRNSWTTGFLMFIFRFTVSHNLCGKLKFIRVSFLSCEYTKTLLVYF